MLLLFKELAKTFLRGYMIQFLELFDLSHIYYLIFKVIISSQ